MSEKQKNVSKKCWQCGKVYSGAKAHEIDQCEKCGCVMFKVLDTDEGVKRCTGDREQISLFGN